MVTAALMSDTSGASSFVPHEETKSARQQTSATKTSGVVFELLRNFEFV
jgi:hypothetical protein